LTPSSSRTTATVGLPGSYAGGVAEATAAAVVVAGRPYRLAF
jgi:hypothetical protein